MAHRNIEDARAQQKAWRQANADALRIKKAAYYKANKEAINDRQKAYYELNSLSIRERVLARAHTPEARARKAEYDRMRAATDRPTRVAKQRRYWFMRQYGLGLETRDAIVKAQRGRCAICLTRFETTRNMHTDHSHETGAVRGILCFKCNSAIGKLNDDPATLRRAADYLEGVFHWPRT